MSETAHQAPVQRSSMASFGESEGGDASLMQSMVPPEHKLLASSVDQAPIQQKVGAGVIQKQDDGTFEAGTGLTAALTDGRMTQDGIQGTNLVIEVANDYKLEFKVSKAYKGVYPYASAGRDVKGVYIKIEAHYTNLGDAGRCRSLQLLQVVRNVRPGAEGGVELADPGTAVRRERSGWGDEDAPSRGWRVDRVSSATDPIYTNGWSGDNGNENTPAILWDAPGSWADTTGAGKDFHTSAVRTKADGSKDVLASINWGFMIDGSGNVAFSPSPPTAQQGNPQATEDAATRWDSIDGNTDTGITF